MYQTFTLRDQPSYEMPRLLEDDQGPMNFGAAHAELLRRRRMMPRDSHKMVRINHNNFQVHTKWRGRE